MSVLDSVALEDVVGSYIDKTVANLKTGVVYDDFLLRHECLWDPDFPENPNRLRAVLARLTELDLLTKCDRIPSRKATEAELALAHSATYIDLLKSTEDASIDTLKEVSAQFDSVYFHPDTYQVELLATGSLLGLTDAILDRRVRNGFALIRPSSHHVTRDAACGFGSVNKISIAVRHAQKRGVKRVMVVDWDVHHGQGTQRDFYEDRDVLTFSVHRYEDGTYWPGLRESNFDHVGEKEGRGFNVNVPLNETGIGDHDYVAIWNHVLLPIAYEFQPELVVIATGFDSAVGDPKGEMALTPTGYAHLCQAMMALSGGRVLAVLEGGYNLESLAEGAASVLLTLQGAPCPQLGPAGPLRDSVATSIRNVVSCQKPFWKCLAIHSDFEPQVVYRGHMAPGDQRSSDPESKSCSDVPVKRDPVKLSHEPNRPQGTSLVFDIDMGKHVSKVPWQRPDGPLYQTHPEKPERILAPYKRLSQNCLIERLVQLPSRSATEAELRLAHAQSLIDQVKATIGQPESKWGEHVYHCCDTFESATLAVGSVLQAIESVLGPLGPKTEIGSQVGSQPGSQPGSLPGTQTGARTWSQVVSQSGALVGPKIGLRPGTQPGAKHVQPTLNGFCLIRPPGHHASEKEPSGFCIFNNVAVGARYVLQNYPKIRKILILDWDVHHGDGIQKIFEGDDRVLYVSLHKYNGGATFPFTKLSDFVTRDQNILNIPWNGGPKNEADYFLAFFNLILPVAYEFGPDLVMVASGFDAAEGCPLEGYKVSPLAYGHFTHHLKRLAAGRIIIALEGGYDTSLVAAGTVQCVSNLLGDPPAEMALRELSPEAVEKLREVIEYQKGRGRKLL